MRKTVLLHMKYKNHNPGEFCGFEGPELDYVLSTKVKIQVDDGRGNMRAQPSAIAETATNLEVLKGFTVEQRIELLKGRSAHLNRDYEPGDRIVAVDSDAAVLVKAGLCEPLEEVVYRKTIKEGSEVLFTRDQRRPVRVSEAAKLEKEMAVRRLNQGSVSPA